MLTLYARGAATAARAAEVSPVRAPVSSSPSLVWSPRRTRGADAREGPHSSLHLPPEAAFLAAIRGLGGVCVCPTALPAERWAVACW